MPTAGGARQSRGDKRGKRLAARTSGERGKLQEPETSEEEAGKQARGKSKHEEEAGARARS